MEWGRLYANLPDDPRVQRAEADAGAGWLLIESICYCTRAESGGFIPDTQLECFRGGTAKKRKIAALVKERLWIRVEDGYTLNPDVWTEERNLSDQAEKKKEADRQRIAAKRAAVKSAQNGHAPAEVADASRDSRATCRATNDDSKDATCRCDSRSVEERREETTTADLVSPVTVTGARENDDDDFDDETIARVASALAARAERVVGPGEARQVITRVLAKAVGPVHSVAAYVTAAVEAEPDVYDLLIGPVASLGEILSDLPLGRPAHCGGCDERTRMREDDDGRPFRCPECHPAALERGA